MLKIYSTLIIPLFQKISLLALTGHLKKHKKPETGEEFCYYLAGLIKGDGYIGERRIGIAFHIDDISSAYFIKKRVGYGSVLFLRDKIR
jgi:hypothetical protein